MKKIILVLTLILFVASINWAQGKRPLLLQNPALSQTHIAFNFAGDIWIVRREGGEAARLTTGVGVENNPIFSPDGEMIAFSGEYDGNVDTYIVPATGGIPRRLTFHPSSDVPVAWTPDGKSILFRSARKAYASGVMRLFTISREGGIEREVPLPMGYEAAYSSDGLQLAYLPLAPAFQEWKQYRGGRTTKIWLANLSDSHVEEVPRQNSNDFNPMWIGKKIYFLSDRNGLTTLFAYDTETKKVAELIRNNDGMDMKSASAGPDAIVCEQFSEIYLYDLKSGRAKKVEITLNGDLPFVRPRYENVANNITNVNISPTGMRAVFEARGEIITVPQEKGNARNLTNSPGVADRDPAWSPDGKWVAYFSDESGEYALHLRNQSGLGEVKKINLGNPSSFFYSPTWSPDSKKIAYTDKRLNLWYVDIEKSAPVKVDTNTYENPFRVMDPAWSPDGKWVAYTKQLKNRLCAVFVYSLETGRSTQITDGMSDARFANFDKNGKYLYFTAGTNAGPTTGWLDMSSFPFRASLTRSVYVVVLRKEMASPLGPESDEEKIVEEKVSDKAAEQTSEKKTEEIADAKGEEKQGTKKEPAKVTIDFDNISQRILALPIPARNYTQMTVGKSGLLFILENASEAGSGPGGPQGQVLHKFDLEKRKLEKVHDGVIIFALSANGEKMLYAQGQTSSAAPGFAAAAPAQRFFIVSATQPIKPGEGQLRTSEAEVYVDPQAEWKQIYHEAWRIQRDFFYDPNLHGLNYEANKKKYEIYLAGLAHRADLAHLFQEMFGNLVVGHHRAGGGDMPSVPQVRVGLLGADYEVENGRYRFARIYNGENWNPQLRAPLTQPGVNVNVGDYLLAVNGRDVRASENIFSFFQGTAGKQIELLVGPNPNTTSAREVTVVPIMSETALRNLAWIEGNRRKVDQMSGGRLAYVYLPNTSGDGYTNFNRYYFAQIDKEGAVIDERFNGGGSAADYIIDYMRRPLMNYWTTREGEDFTTPVASIYGPKAMIVNEYAGSGGDLMPWLFRKAGIGPLVGMRTWGGLVGIYDYPQLIDGGTVTAPRVAFYNLQGEWDVENHGTAPDVEVDLDPAAWREGRDPQLEKAVEVVMAELKKNPLPKRKKPSYPNYNGHIITKRDNKQSSGDTVSTGVPK